MMPIAPDIARRMASRWVYRNRKTATTARATIRSIADCRPSILLAIILRSSCAKLQLHCHSTIVEALKRTCARLRDVAKGIEAEGLAPGRSTARAADAHQIIITVVASLTVGAVERIGNRQRLQRAIRVPGQIARSPTAHSRGMLDSPLSPHVCKNRKRGPPANQPVVCGIP